MLWLKQDKPAKRPADPKRVNLTAVLAMLTQNELTGAPMSPAIKYLAAHLPQRVTDRWGRELQLSTVEQEKLDRIAAVLFDPLRSRQLLTSGRLDTIEVDALKGGQPGWYAALYASAKADMVIGKPPFPQWADGVLGVLFGRDAALVYGDDTTDDKGQKHSQFSGKPPIPTPADLNSEPALKR